MEVFIIVGVIVGLALGYFAASKIAAAKAGQPDAELEKQQAVYQSQIESLEGRLKANAQELVVEREKSVSAGKEVAELGARKEQLEKNISEFEKRQAALLEDMKGKFQNLANEALKKNTEELKSSSGDVLKPLGASINEFKNRIEDFNSAQGKMSAMLNSELQKMMQTSMNLGQQADGLAKTLRGDVKKQGNWGELKLERILENSGLRAGKEYILQAKQMGLRDDEGGKRQPDAIILLPDKRHLIIDSKVSLRSFDTFVNTEDRNEKDQALGALIRSVKDHSMDLSGKAYQKLEGLNTPDYVVMFMASEMAYQLVMTHAEDVILDAWKRKVVIATPANLMGILKTASSLWAMENRNKNADKIAKEAAGLFDKFVALLEDMDSLKGGIQSLDRMHGEAMIKLEGKGGITRRIENLRGMGVEPKKRISQNSLDRAGLAVSDGDGEE